MKQNPDEALQILLNNQNEENFPLKEEVEKEDNFKEEVKIEAVKPKRTRKTKAETKQEDKVEDSTYTIKRKKKN